MTINIKNFLNEKTKLSKMGEFQSLKQIDGLELGSVMAPIISSLAISLASLNSISNN